MNRENKPDLQSVLKKSPQELLSWVKHKLNQSGVEDHWWFGLAQVATDNALSNYEPEEPGNLEWAEIAMTIYNYLIKGAGRDEYLNSAMRIRVSMINKVGTDARNEILRLDKLVKWFVENLSLSLDEVLTYSKMDLSLLSQAGSKLLELRKIKVRLGILAQLEEKYRLQLGEEINKWLEIRNELP